MKLIPLLLLGAVSHAVAKNYDKPPPEPFTGQHHIPTSRESAVMGRRILRLTKLATFSTVFPSNPPSSAERRLRDGTPANEAAFAGFPVGLSDYVADCEPDGNPTILDVKIGTTFRNVRAGSNLTVSLRWTPPFPPSRRIGVPPANSSSVPAAAASAAASTLWSWISALPSTVTSSIGSLRTWLFEDPARRASDGRAPNPEDPRIPDTVSYSADNLPRFALFGRLEMMDGSNGTEADRLAGCYTAKHPDSRLWLPGNGIHESAWARLVVTGVYWVGGFGDRAYIGWISAEEWRGVSEDDLRTIKLPGETAGWSEYTVSDDQEL